MTWPSMKGDPEAMARIQTLTHAQLVDRVASVLDLCEEEQVARHDPCAEMPAIVITHTLLPEVYTLPEGIRGWS